MHIDKRENKFFAYFIFLIWPFLSLGLAIKNYRESWAKNIVWLFAVFFGYSIVISNSAIDANRYRDKLVETANDGNEKTDMKMYDGEDKDSFDFAQPAIVLLISTFTDNYKILFAVYGLIFGYFYSRNIWMILGWKQDGIALTFVGLLLLLTFILINPIWNINGFRYYTAAQVYIFGALIYFIQGKKQGIWYILSSFLIHFSFVIAITIFLIYFFLGDKVIIYFYFFISSLFIEGLQLESVRDNIIYLPDAVQDRTAGYVNEEYAEGIRQSYESANWYLQGHRDALHYAISAMLIILFWLARNTIKNNKLLFSYFSFILLFYGFANIMSSIPSAGRFLNPASSMAISLIFIVYVTYYNNKNNLINSVLKTTIPLLLIFMVVAIRIGFDTIGISTILGNPIFATFMQDDRALIELIK